MGVQIKHINDNQWVIPMYDNNVIKDIQKLNDGFYSVPKIVLNLNHFSFDFNFIVFPAIIYLSSYVEERQDIYLVIKTDDSIIIIILEDIDDYFKQTIVDFDIISNQLYLRSEKTVIINHDVPKEIKISNLIEYYDYNDEKEFPEVIKELLIKFEKNIMINDLHECDLIQIKSASKERLLRLLEHVPGIY